MHSTNVVPVHSFYGSLLFIDVYGRESWKDPKVVRVVPFAASSPGPGTEKSMNLYWSGATYCSSCWWIWAIWCCSAVARAVDVRLLCQLAACCCTAAAKMFWLATEVWDTLNMGERLGATFGRAAVVILVVGAPRRVAVASCCCCCWSSN